MNKSKAQRRQWWYDLAPEQQQKQIEKWQMKKAERRRENPPGFLTERLKKAYPWYVDGVDETNRKRWLRMVHKKNPWLKSA